MNTHDTLALRALADRILAGEHLAPHDAAALDVLLRDPEARAFYLATIEVETNLPDAVEHAEVTRAVAASNVVTFYRRTWFVATTAAAAALVAGLFLSKITAPEPGPIKVTHKAAPPAQITGLIGVRWRSEHADPYRADIVDIDSGLVEITYGTGTRVVLEGPAKFKVTGDNLGELEHGRFVAHVPKGAEGFTVDYRNGRIIDLGTEYGCQLEKDGRLKLGVFEGEVELLTKGATQPAKLTKDHAVEQSASAPDALVTIPFDRNKFIREAPSRELPWHITSAKPTTTTFDISPLIWRSGSYRFIFKWMRGVHASRISGLRVLCDGRPVFVSSQNGIVGKLQLTRNNVFDFTVPKDAYRRGVWTVEATLTSHDEAPFGSETSWAEGILMVEDGDLRNATAADFTGTWTYRHDGADWKRVINSDGTTELYRNDQLRPSWEGATWNVSQGVLRIVVPAMGVTETHILRDANTLIFLDQPYRNAERTPPQK